MLLRVLGRATKGRATMSGEGAGNTAGVSTSQPPLCDSSENGLDRTSESQSLKLPLSGVPQLLPPSLPSRTTENASQVVRRRTGVGKDEKVTVACDSGNYRLDYYTDKAVMQSTQKDITEVMTKKEIHTESSKEISSTNDRYLNPDLVLDDPATPPPHLMEGVSDSEADSVSSTALDDSAITHTFTFPLLSRTGEEEPHQENESATGAHRSKADVLLDSIAVKPKTRMKKKQGSKVTGKDAKDSDSSVSSRKKGASSKKTKIKSKFAPGSLEYIEERLKGRVFSGWVEERRWVEGVNGYRDVIEVDEWEVEMNQQLKAIVASISGVQEGTKWINITPPTSTPTYRLWVLLAAPPRPGHYWFTVTDVHLQPQFGLRVVVKEIRQIHLHDGESTESRRRRQKKRRGSNTSEEIESLSEQVQDWLEQARQANFTLIWEAITSTLTITNIRESIRFVVVLVMTLVLGLMMVVKESHHLGLRFIREAGIFFHNITPFMQTVLAFIEKIVGGMYLLLAMVYRDFRRPGPPSRLPPPPPPYARALPPATSFPTTPYTPQQTKYVPPEQWVFRTEAGESSPS